MGTGLITNDSIHTMQNIFSPFQAQRPRDGNSFLESIFLFLTRMEKQKEKKRKMLELIK